jgi:glucose/arabinose dehydrogenase
MDVNLVRSIGAFAIAGLLGQAGASPQVSGDLTGNLFRTKVIVSGLKVPSAIAFLPDGRALLAERATGRVSLVDVTKGVMASLEGVPPALLGDDAGIHDVALHPDYLSNGWIYVTYSVGEPDRSTTALDRMRLKDHAFVDRTRVFTAEAYSEERFHYGGRIAFSNGYLFLTIGDRHHERWAQQLSNDAGKILRLYDDGRVPPDNPFVSTDGARPEIWSYGHRHSQGIAFEPGTDTLWEHEHGPLAGDELNIIEKGANYGWPVISYGWQYDGGPIGRGIVEQDGLKQPLKVWTPAVAPSGMLWYAGDRFPAWRRSLFIGAMTAHDLIRLTIRNGRVVSEERLLEPSVGRVRSIAESPDGLLYIGTDGGQLLELSPSRPTE